MGFKKGNKLGKGRPKGSVNIATHEKRQLIEHIKNTGAEKFIAEMMTLEGMEYCKIYKDVIEIAFPKLSRVEQQGKVDHDVTFKWQ